MWRQIRQTLWAAEVERPARIWGRVEARGKVVRGEVSSEVR